MMNFVQILFCFNGLTMNPLMTFFHLVIIGMYAGVRCCDHYNACYLTALFVLTIIIIVFGMIGIVFNFLIFVVAPTADSLCAYSNWIEEVEHEFNYGNEAPKDPSYFGYETKEECIKMVVTYYWVKTFFDLFCNIVLIYCCCQMYTVQDKVRTRNRI